VPSRWSRPVDGATIRDQTSAASPAARARPSVAAAGRSGEGASPANRARARASRSGRLGAGRPRRPLLSVTPGALAAEPPEARPDLVPPAAREQELRRGQQDELLDRADAPLVGGVEGAQG